jgi:glutathione-regulated potassium-efflux system ancillary protein KefF
MILALYAHPYPDRSRANRVLVDAIRDVPDVVVRSLYDLYPDFAIDVEEEQRLLGACSVVVWQHPLYWYTAPALLKLWFEKVLARGWAYGPGGRALVGKRCMWVATTGADVDAYTPEGPHQHPFDSFEPVMRQTAQFCGMKWLPPLIVHAAHELAPQELHGVAQGYRARLESLAAEAQARPEVPGA